MGMAETRKGNLLTRRNKLRSKLQAEEEEHLSKIRKLPVVQKSLKDVRTEYEEMKQRDREQKIEDWKQVILSQIAELKQRRKEEEQEKREVGKNKQEKKLWTIW